MAADPDVRRSILSRYAVSAADRIGEDDEAEVYALGTHRIIKDLQARTPFKDDRAS
jgi:hypothetical protein